MRIPTLPPPSDLGRSPAQPAVQVRELRKVYPAPLGLLDLVRHPLRRRPGVQALRDVSFEAYTGEVLGLLGPNGAGKTTLLKILANLVGPTSGHVRVAGFDVARNPLEVRRRVGHVSNDERNFFWRLSGLENLRFFATLHEIPTADAERRIDHYLELFSLRTIAHRRFAEYSSGRKKLFTIIRGLIPEPPVILLDEPTNSLDPQAAKHLMLYVHRELVAERGRTVIWATHRLEEVDQLCDRVMLIDRGEIRFLDSVGAFAHLRNPEESPHAAHSLIDVFERLLTE